MGTSKSSSCLSEETLLAFVRGDLSEIELAHADHHIAQCADCRSTVADVEDYGAPTETELVPTRHRAAAARRESRRRVHAGAFTPGTTIDRYIVLEMIGSGGMGVVYAARDSALNRKISLKVLRNERRNDGDAQAQLIREARALARLSHPNVVAIHDVGTHHGQVFIAMEFINGESLSDWLRRKRRTWQEVLSAFIDAGEGLAAAHDAAFVHRDFKPANVLVGADRRVRVVDFGLARSFAHCEKFPDPTDRTSPSISTKHALATSTGAGALKGTPAYMAPEQFLREPVTPRTDQFSFCVALYRSLFGCRPFISASSDSLIDEVLSGQVRPRPPDSEVPNALHAIIARGLARNPESRHGSMHDLLVALRQASRPQSSGSSKRRAKTALAVGAAVSAAALVVGLVAWEHDPTRGDAPRSREEERAPISASPTPARPVPAQIVEGGGIRSKGVERMSADPKLAHFVEHFRAAAGEAQAGGFRTLNNSGLENQLIEDFVQADDDARLRMIAFLARRRRLGLIAELEAAAGIRGGRPAKRGVDTSP
jgi:serine/threonine protein kinase